MLSVTANPIRHVDPIRRNVDLELKEEGAILAANPRGWEAIHTALVSAAHDFATGEHDLVKLAKTAVERTHEGGFSSLPDEKRTRFTGSRIMAWQDALFVVNELEDWRFPDEILCVGWLVECGGPPMGRGPARARFLHVELYIGGTRDLYNLGEHGNGPGWPTSHWWLAEDCRHMRTV